MRDDKSLHAYLKKRRPEILAELGDDRKKFQSGVAAMLEKGDELAEYTARIELPEMENVQGRADIFVLTPEGTFVLFSQKLLSGSLTEPLRSMLLQKPTMTSSSFTV